MRGKVVAAALLVLQAAGMALPAAGAERPWRADRSVAVVIGNADYADPMPDVAFAHRDADAFRTWLVAQRGYLPENVIDLRDANLRDLYRVFGTASDHRGQLSDWVRPDSEVTVFYSGHGVPGETADGERRGFLLPVDADAEKPSLTGYDRQVLLDNLARLDVPRVLVFLDACFSGFSDGGALVQGVSASFGIEVVPAKPQASVSVLTAASAAQFASWDREAGHGLFTEYLLRGLYGAADAAGTGNGDGRVALAEVKT